LFEAALPNSACQAENDNDITLRAGPSGGAGGIDRDGRETEAYFGRAGGGDDQQWVEMLDCSFSCDVRAGSAVVPGMVGGRGAIINISSIAGRVGWPGVIDYAAAKAALDSHCKFLSTALAPRGMR
jgi:NAD(P)-dependent dehydrogenase (short-subunit alcohol dehydrogenase family)